MINQKYYNDIKDFPNQFSAGFELATKLTIEGEFNQVVVCGMGGSSLYVEMLNNYFSTFTKLRLQVVRGYEIPNYSDEKTLFITASHSGNTEETVSCLESIIEKKYKAITFTSGGKLAEISKANNIPVFSLPGAIQPRLTTGFFISGILAILIRLKLISDVKQEILKAAELLDSTLNEENAKKLASELKNKVPIIYLTDNVSGIARISKIKFNENSKTQAFWNEIPEANHNEMVGFTNLVMEPFFILLRSQFTHPRNTKRMEILKKLMLDKGSKVWDLELKGSNVFEEMLNVYYFIDHVTYYLSEQYGIDPEPVDMVEDFKKLLK